MTANKGATLTELLLVVALLAVLASLTAAAVAKATKGARQNLFLSSTLHNIRMDAALEGKDNVLEYYCGQSRLQWYFQSETK